MFRALSPQHAGSAKPSSRRAGHTAATHAAGPLLLFLLLVLGPAGCGNGKTAQPVRKAWTVLVYMAADNDLAPDALLNINQMERVGSTGGLNIVAELDLPASLSGVGRADARRLLILHDDDPRRVTSPVLQELGQINTGRPEALRDFLSWGVASFPAERFALVLWNHGSGWRARQGGRGVLFDDTHSSFMTTPELNAGLSAPGTHFDLIAFDASLMQMLEVAYEIRGRADFIAGSEESPPGTGYPYDALLSPLAANPGLSPEEFGRVIVREHVAAYPSVPVTQSLVRTAQLADLGRRVSDLGGALAALLPAQAGPISQARIATQAYEIPYYRDLFDFARNVLDGVPDARAQSAATAVLQAFPPFGEGPVVAEAHNLPQVAGSHGLSIFLPGPGQLFAGYDALQLSQDFPAWLQFVRAIGGMPAGAVSLTATPAPRPGAVGAAPRVWAPGPPGKSLAGGENPRQEGADDDSGCSRGHGRDRDRGTDAQPQP